MRRKKLSRRRSRRSFTRNAGAHPKNHRNAPMRGGIRL